jgi:signal transduction histidine kinase/ActR/RegA family two-component response regulator
LADALLLLALVMQALAVAYGVFLLSRRQGAAGAWLFLLGAMTSMLVWRMVVVTGITPPQFFNPLIAIWGSTCMVGAMCLFGREVTRRNRAEAERDALLESERAARSDAERASRLKDDFLATLSHELRTPLAAILGWCEVLKLGQAGPDGSERALQTIERNARVQARLVDDLLDVTRLQAGALHLELAAVALDVPVRAAVLAWRRAASARSLALEVRIDSAPPLVNGDAGRLQQVAANLLVNALKFTPEGGRITVTVRCTDDGRAELSVTDDGEGIEESFLPQLFTRFRQADSGTTRRHGGLGLGLSIVSSLVSLHGGEVLARSDGLGQGATFTVRLPLAPGVPGAGGNRDAHGVPQPSSLSESLADVRILLVDDEEDVRTAVTHLLEQDGAEVRALAAGAEAEVELARHRPHVLILDIGMHGEDGYSLLRRLRALPPGSGGDTPAISLTAHAREEDRERALAAGFQDHLPKPVNVAALVSVLRRLVDGAARRGGE